MNEKEKIIHICLHAVRITKLFSLGWNSILFFHVCAVLTASAACKNQIGTLCFLNFSVSPLQWPYSMASPMWGPSEALSELLRSF